MPVSGRWDAQGLFLACGIAIGCVSGPSPALTADIFVTSWDCYFHDKCNDDSVPPWERNWAAQSQAVVIRGDIATGDAKKFRDVLRATGRDGVATIDDVWLRSRGGNANEAVKIGRDVRQMLMETVGPIMNYSSDNNLAYYGGEHPLCLENGYSESNIAASRYKGAPCVCASACFLIYAAGARRRLSYVGLHRVHLDPLVTERLDINNAAELQRRAAGALNEYLTTMGVPRILIERLANTASTDLYVPTYPEMETQLVGWASEVEEWLIAKCKTVTDKQFANVEKRALREGQLANFVKEHDRRELCMAGVLLEERGRRRRALLALP